MSDLERSQSLIQTETKVCSAPARIPGSNTFETYELELGLRSVKYFRTYRPSWLSSKVVEEGELFFDNDQRQQRARPVDEVMIRRKHGLYIPFKGGRCMYIQARSTADQRDWLNKIETNLTKLVYLDRLRRPTDIGTAAPPAEMFGETVLLCGPVHLSVAGPGGDFGPPRFGRVLCLSRTLVFESEENDEPVSLDIPAVLSLTRRSLQDIARSIERHIESIPLAGACTGDLLVYSQDETRWSLNFATELSLELMETMLNRIRGSRERSPSDLHSLSPRSMVSEDTLDFDANYAARLDGMDSRLARLFCSRLHVAIVGEWAQYEGVSAHCQLGEVGGRVWYAKELVGFSSDPSLDGDSSKLDFAFVLPASELVTVSSEEGQAAVQLTVRMSLLCQEESTTVSFVFPEEADASTCCAELAERAKRAGGSSANWAGVNQYLQHSMASSYTEEFTQRWVQAEQAITQISLDDHLYRREVCRRELWDPESLYEFEWVDPLGFDVKESMVDSTRYDWTQDSLTNPEREAQWEQLSQTLMRGGSAIGPELRGLARKGLPHRYRGEIWFRTSGAQYKQAFNDPDMYKRLSGQNFNSPASFSVKRKLADEFQAQSVHPATVVPKEQQLVLEEQVDKDLDCRTFSGHALLKMTRIHGPCSWPMNDRFRCDLGDKEQFPLLPPSVALLPVGLLQPARRIVLAFAKYRPELGYTQGMAPLAVLLLMVMPEEQAFWTFAAVYEDLLPNMVCAGGGACQSGMMAIKSYFTKKLNEQCPELVEHCEAVSEEVSMLGFLIDTIVLPIMIKLTCDEMPPYFSLRVLDLFFCDGPHVLFAAAISVFLLNKEMILSKESADELMIAGQRMKAGLQELVHHSQDSTEKLLMQIEEMVQKLGDPEATLRASMEAAEAEKGAVAEKHQELRDSCDALSASVESDVFGVDGSEEQDLLEQSLSELEQHEQQLQQLEERIVWIQSRSEEHRDWNQRVLGSVLPTLGTRISEDWHCHIAVHSTECLWQRAASHDVRDVLLLLKLVSNANAADPNDGGASALHKAVKAFTPSLCDCDSSEQDKLKCSNAQQNRLETIRVLLEHPGVDVDLQLTSDGSTALHLATRADLEASIEVLSLLLEKGARVLIQDCNGFTPVHHAAANASFATLTHLLCRAETQGVLQEVVDAQTLFREHRALHLAARGSSADGCTRAMCCQTLVLMKADPRATGALGETALHVAARWGDPNVCKELVDAGANINARCEKCLTAPLHLAVEEMEVIEFESEVRDSSRFSGYECCLRLLQLKALPDAITTNGWSPLLLAARRGNSELCDLLLKLASMNTVAISQATSQGWGALHMAATSGSATTCELLVRLGANKKKVAIVHEIDGTTSSMTPSDLAQYLHDHNHIYENLCASCEFGRSSNTVVIEEEDVGAPAEESRSFATSFGVETPPETQFEGVVRVLKGELNPEDQHAIHNQKVVNTVKKFRGIGI